MRFKLLSVMAAAVGILALGVAPASAKTVNWQIVSTNSNWYCGGGYITHPVSEHVNFKACLVVNANNDAQTVLVVQNTASVAVAIGGLVFFDGGSVSNTTDCAASTLNPGFTRGCFGPTFHIDSGTRIWGNGNLTLNGVTQSYGWVDRWVLA
ncbi:hypothetical protein [Streptomyces galbus]|uniref:Secreted protein n=1 Tax=Streptomyces galbus TaxID=33898 RepID=A0A4U5X686_STRGB|nr:hypothetical protein [Streptomyces galbus]TKT10574.1 hypothetical protein E4U92_06520 [Streptomyces galbus]GHD21869.1 hypothetical protein GCM10010335_02340 [Streptomyces galbus]